ncbi:uncharacterized protein BDR25DRAFT_280695 [Lindgomyces ingoldianus]|uniref:Uncharacterized protein n=1 Tax=Lindgomyces ingoldianus TaxID=673940 RepID=A0ACB6R7B2_9PLEO|nr:uncharacterized protein BDR25DRAFT_280695 [Lindgomyces ingoldianus]KAF2475061.1 hypothetical protein BDR25DRAFT_280695 [Lindgomyces ingoldianus]
MKMRLVSALCIELFVQLALADDTPKHGEGEEGKSMGPVAFLWPDDRVWNATYDNAGPCGSPAGVTNRTIFPLSQGAVALTIADDSWEVAVRVAFSNDPTTQAEFSDQVVNNVSEVAPGHQCYRLNQLEGKTAGTNATIQLEYWSEFEGENDGKNQSFFACADVTFVEAKDFTLAVPCFNVTSDGFNEPAPSNTPSSISAAPTNAAPTTASPVRGTSSGSLSIGARAGIAVGSIIGGLAIIGGIAFLAMRKGRESARKEREEYELRTKTLST